MEEFNLEKGEFLMAVDTLEDSDEKLQKYNALLTMERKIAKRYVEIINAKSDLEKIEKWDEMNRTFAAFNMYLAKLAGHIRSQKAHDMTMFFCLSNTEASHALKNCKPREERVKIIYFLANTSLLFLRGCLKENLDYYKNIIKGVDKAAQSKTR